MIVNSILSQFDHPQCTEIHQTLHLISCKKTLLLQKNSSIERLSPQYAILYMDIKINIIINTNLRNFDVSEGASVLGANNICPGFLAVAEPSESVSVVVGLATRRQSHPEKKTICPGVKFVHFRV